MKNLIYYLCFFHFASLQRAALYPPLQAQRSGSLFLSSPSFQTDVGAPWTQGVKYLSWVDASNSVCLTSIHAASTSLGRCRAAVRKGRLWLQQLLMPPFALQPVEVGSCSQTAPSPLMRRCELRAVWPVAAGAGTAATMEMEAVLHCSPRRLTPLSTLGEVVN